MEKIRFGVVGLGHRGRHMARLAKDAFPFTEFVCACDVDPKLFYETQWMQTQPLKELYPGTAFYADYDEMLAKEAMAPAV